MEDESSELGMKLGDLTEFLETAKTAFETQVSARVANATTPLKVDPKKVEKKVKDDSKGYLKDAVARIESLEKNLAEQTKKSQAEVTAANKNLNVLIAKESKDMENKTKMIKKNL